MLSVKLSEVLEQMNLKKPWVVLLRPKRKMKSILSNVFFVEILSI